MKAVSGLVSLAGGAMARRPVLMAGVSGFAIAFAFVAANAVWYQPHPHQSAFFATRDAGSPPAGTPAPAVPAPRPMDFASLPDEEAGDTVDFGHSPLPDAPARPAADAQEAVIAQVQRVLADLKLYKGDIDGLDGPQTRAAIADYREKVGLPPSEEIDGELLGQLGAREEQATAAPPPANTDAISTASAGPGQTNVLRVQAGLKAFGNADIEMDGVVGPRTVAAIREFQSLFGLPVTGEPNAETFAKMREIGLTD